MSRNKTKNTFHAYDRAAERLGVPKAEAKRLMTLASRSTMNLCKMPEGPIKHFLTLKSKTGKRIKYVNGFVFVFCKNSTRCLTMYKLEDEILKAQELYNKGTSIGYCPKCKHYFSYEEDEQTPGFRDMEELRCPHCDKIIRKSMEWEFYDVRKI